VLSYPNLYSWNVQSFDSGTLPIAANSSNEHGFYYGGGVGSIVKKVEVVVDNGPWGMHSMWGDCVWIKHPFQMSLLRGQGDSIETTTETSPRVDYTFDVPSSWSTLGGVRISNPENQPVAVTVEVIFHSQILNSSWETAMIMGLIVTVIGIVLIPISIKKGRTSVPPPP